MLRGIFASGGGAPVGGSGTTNYLAKWLTGTTLTSGIIFDNGTSVGIAMTSGIPGRMGVRSQNNISTADLTFSYDATGSYRHGFSNVFSSTTAANNTSSWLVWNAAGALTNVITAQGDGTVSITGNVYAASGTTGMTSGFFYIAAAAGAPTGVPTAVTGRVPMYYDTTNNKFYIYNGAWKQVALT